MITTISEFQCAVAYETYVLDKTLPVISNNQNRSIRWRDGHMAIEITIIENMSAEAVERLKNILAPLMFGAAWKILDLALEFALNRKGLKADKSRGTEWSINAKKEHAAQGAGYFQVLTSDPQIWAAIGALYANTAEHRHCLIHRTAIIDSNSRALSGKDKLHNKVLKQLELDQQKAIARIALLVAEGIVGGGISPRNGDHLRYFLDQVGSHTNQPSFGVTRQSAPTEIRTVLKIIDDQYVVDVGAAAREAAIASPGVLHFNMVFDIPDGSGRHLKANLEEIPTGQTVVNLDALPPWLSFI